MRRLIGYILFLYSWLAWAAIAAVPFLGLSVALAATVGTALLVSGEIAFVASLALLGPEFWQKIKFYFSGPTKSGTIEHQTAENECVNKNIE